MDTSQPNRTTRLFPVVLAVGIAVRIWLWLQPLERLLTWTLADDSFYYFVVARNISQGLGSTFDGLNPTNGYHPLWMAVNVLMFALFPHENVAIYGLLLIEWLIDIAAGLALAYLAYRLYGDHIYSLIVGTLWLLNHRIIASLLSGMETAISTLLIILSILATWLLQRDRSLKKQVFLGIIVGLAVLARTDNAFLIGLLYLVILLTHRSIKPLILPTALAILVAAPWFLWSRQQFGSMMQGSAMSLTGLIRLRLEAQYGAPVPTAAMLRYSIPLWLRTLSRIYFLSGLPVGIWVLASAAWVMGGLILLIRRIGHPRLAWLDASMTPRRLLLAALATWPLVFITLHIFNRLYFRPHYYLALAPSVILFCGLLLRGLSRGGHLSRGWAWLFAPLLIFSAYQFTQSELLHNQIGLYQAAQWINEHSEGCATVGAFNSGILGYYCRERVVNLDGVINNNAHAAIWSRRLGAYAQEQEVCLLADLEATPGELVGAPEWGGTKPTQAEMLFRSELPWRMHYAIYRVSWDEP